MARPESVTIKAFGKLNLMLDIVGKRNNGYHELETVMQSVDLFDTLTFYRNGTGQNRIVCDTPGFPCDETNLICKAINAFSQYTSLRLTGITARVEKRLPSMAGMAGGSADCAATLHAMNKMFETDLSTQQLCDIAVGLGADVPFCVVGGTQLCKGVGEKMQRLSAPKCSFLVIKPEISISTPDAFKKYDSLGNVQKHDMNSFLKSLENGDLKAMCDGMFNALDFASQENEIHIAKQKLLNAGAIGALMTGSGSAVFGVFEEDTIKADAALNAVKDSYSNAWLCLPVNTGTEIINTK